MHFEKESFRSVHYIIWHWKKISWKILHNEKKKSRETFVATRDFYLDDEFRHSRPIYLAATLINDYCSADEKDIK